MRFSPSCGCCGICPADPSNDGNEYSTDFSSALSGWTPAVGETFSSSGGFGLYRTGLFPTGSFTTAYRTASLTPSGVKIIVQSTVYSIAGSSGNGIWWDDFGRYGLIAQWETGEYYITYYEGGFASSYAALSPTIAPADGDILKMQFTETSQCYYINGVLVFSVAEMFTISASTRCGVSAQPYGGMVLVNTDIGKFDDFSIHVGNP